MYVEVGSGDGEEIVIAIIPGIPSARGEVVEGISVKGITLSGGSSSSSSSSSSSGVGGADVAARGRSGGRNASAGGSPFVLEGEKIMRVEN